MTNQASSSEYLLQLRKIHKSFPGVQALAGASFELKAGEIHALVGENGAGKSTLIKILTGVHQSDSGDIILYGEHCKLSSPSEALARGIATIYQEFTLVPTLSVSANIFLGREKSHVGFINPRLESTAATKALELLGISIDPQLRVSDLSIAQQQMVEIARALASDVRILVMDEPTAALSPHEVESLFKVLRDLSARGTGIIFISHRLDEVFAIADRVTVMRDGLTVETRKASELSRDTIIRLMVGRSIEEEYPRSTAEVREKQFEVLNLSSSKIDAVSFVARRGEILGIAGLMGAGRSELARLIFGADKRLSGNFFLDGKELHIKTPIDAIKSGVCLLTEDRKAQGLILRASVRDNFSLPSLKHWSRWSWIDRKRESKRFSARVSELKIRIAGPHQSAEHLSGGNQQKLLFARWLETESQVIIFDEPTRGIDVGAKYEMYLLINALAAQGKVIIVISSELPELLGICNRILVMRQGRLAGEIADARLARQEDIMAYAV